MHQREPIENLEKRIRFESFKYGLRNEHIDDSTQDVLLRMLQGEHKHSTIGQAVIDHIRREYGDKRIRSYDQRKAFLSPNEYSDESHRGLLHSNIQNELGVGITFRTIYRCSHNEKERAIIDMLYQGFNISEISRCIKKSVKYVQLKIDRIKSMLEKQIGIKNEQPKPFSYNPSLDYKKHLIKLGYSKRESEVIELVSHGLTNEEIAMTLFVTVKAIRFQLGNIYKKSNLNKRSELLQWSKKQWGGID